MSRCRPGRCSRRTTSTPGSSCRSTPARRPSRSPGGRCSSSTIPTSPGSHADDLAKRINVAHDWLSDPALRARYDDERHPRPACAPSRVGWAPRTPHVPRTPRGAATPPHAGRSNPAEAVERHLARVRRLSPDELDRLSLAESPPIAFVASISRFLSADQAAARRGPRATGPGRAAAGRPLGRRRRATRPSATPRRSCSGRSSTPTFSEPFRERVRERLTRGWEAAVDQPRYGPNSRRRPGGDRAASDARPDRAAAGSRGRGPRRPARRTPWPRGLSPGRGRRAPRLVRARPARRGRPRCPIRCRRCFAARSAGRCTRLVLRHAFKPAELERLVGPWSAAARGRSRTATGDPRQQPPASRSRPIRSNGAASGRTSGSRVRWALRSAPRSLTPLTPIHSSP